MPKSGFIGGRDKPPLKILLRGELAQSITVLRKRESGNAFKCMRPIRGIFLEKTLKK